MGFWIFPDGYVVPTPPTPHVLTTVQRDDIKLSMQTYITNQDRPIYSTDLITLGQQRLLSEYGVFVSEDQLEAIAQEIRDEWGVPGGGGE